MKPTAAPDTIRVGVAGLGKMGLLHAAVFSRLPGSRVAAVADPSPVVRRLLPELLPDVRLFEETGAMLAAEPLGAVVITTPVADHVPAALQCVRLGVPFFLEKPLAADARQGADLAAAWKRSPVIHLIGYMTRFVPAFERGRELVTSGILGRLHRVTATLYVSQLFTQGKGWRYERRTAGGGVLLAQGSHLLDLLCWYFGRVARITAQVQAVYSAEVEDFAHVLLEFRSGLRGWLDCSWSQRFHRTVETTIEVQGDDGSLTVTDDTVRLFLERATASHPAGLTVWTAADLYQGVPVDVGGPQYTREDEAFLRGVQTGRQPHPDLEDALHVQEIVETAYRSADAGGAPQEIPPNAP